MPEGYPTLGALQAGGWLPVPRERFGFRSIVAASRNDPLARFERVAELARAWGSRLDDLGEVGHLNPPPASARGRGQRITSLHSRYRLARRRQRDRGRAWRSDAHEPPTRSAPAVVRAAATRDSIKVERLTCAIGAELSGTLRSATPSRDDALFAEIRALLLKHKVLFLRDQDITRAEHVAFARRFGELEDHPVAGSDPRPSRAWC